MNINVMVWRDPTAAELQWGKKVLATLDCIRGIHLVGTYQEAVVFVVPANPVGLGQVRGVRRIRPHLKFVAVESEDFCEQYEVGDLTDLSIISCDAGALCKILQDFFDAHHAHWGKRPTLRPTLS